MIAVLNTGLANAASVLYAIERSGHSATLTQDPDQIYQSSRVIFPGVGTANALMSRIQELEIQECLTSLKSPVLGICLGMQALYDFSEEGNASCLGIFRGRVQRLAASENLSLPHMGWNQVNSVGTSLLLKGVEEGSHFYFVHSFRAPEGPETRAVTEYGDRIPAVVEAGQWFGTQFHPERSGAAGEKVILNFLNL